MNGVQQEFAGEIARRGFRMSLEEATGRYRIELDGASTLVSLTNLEKEVAKDGDMSRVTRFADTVAATFAPKAYTREGLVWILEPNDYVERADFRLPVSDRVDRVLAHLSADRSALAWVSSAILKDLGLDESAASTLAFANLDRELAGANLEFSDIQGVKLGFLGAQQPLKAPLILAPGLRAKVEVIIGWPLLAVVPDRDFMYLWAARHQDFAEKVGRVVVESFEKAPYPISTEVYSIDEQGIRAIGAFSHPSKKA